MVLENSQGVVSLLATYRKGKQGGDEEHKDREGGLSHFFLLFSRFVS
jgi:hypothetical protein